MYTIEDFKKGKVAIKHDGTVEELNNVLHAALGICRKAAGDCLYYAVHNNSREWVGATSDIYLPTQSVKEFYKQLKSEKMRDERFPFKLVREEVKRIVDIACDHWKEKLFRSWGRTLLSQDHVVIQKDEYKEMRKACTDDQHKLFDEIFGEDEEFKVGDWVVVHQSFLEEYELIKFKGKAVQVIESTKHTPRTHYNISIPLNREGGFNVPLKYLIKATPEEIAKAQCPYEDGELCWVRDYIRESWEARYATGKVESGIPTFYPDQAKEGPVITWKYHCSAGGAQLPKN